MDRHIKMESKLLNLMLYRQTLLQKHLWNKLKEMEMQLEMMKTFLGELKDATDYFKTDFGKNELTGFPIVDDFPKQEKKVEKKPYCWLEGCED